MNGDNSPKPSSGGGQKKTSTGSALEVGGGGPYMTDKHFEFEVWSWGRGHRGQPGQGDMLDHLQLSNSLEPNPIKIAIPAQHPLF